MSSSFNAAPNGWNPNAHNYISPNAHAHAALTYYPASAFGRASGPSSLSGKGQVERKFKPDPSPSSSSSARATSSRLLIVLPLLRSRRRHFVDETTLRGFKTEGDVGLSMVTLLEIFIACLPACLLVSFTQSIHMSSGGRSKSFACKKALSQGFFST